MSPYDATSLSLLARLRNPSDQEAWARFCELYCPLIERWLLARGLKEQDACDVRQEVIRVALTELPRFRHAGREGSFRCWLRRTVGHQLQRFWREKNRAGGEAGDPLAIAEQLEDPDSELSRIWDSEYQHAVCAHLLTTVESEFEQRTMEAFRRVALDGKSTKVVAEELDMTPNAVRVAQSRVLHRLREIGEEMLA